MLESELKKFLTAASSLKQVGRREPSWGFRTGPASLAAAAGSGRGSPCPKHGRNRSLVSFIRKISLMGLAFFLATNRGALYVAHACNYFVQ